MGDTDSTGRKILCLYQYSVTRRFTSFNIYAALSPTLWKLSHGC